MLLERWGTESVEHVLSMCINWLNENNSEGGKLSRKTVSFFIVLTLSELACGYHLDG